MLPPSARFPSAPNMIHSVCIPYKSSEQGAAIGAHTLPGLLPAGAIIFSGFVRPVTITSSATDIGTVKLTLQTVDILAASLPAVLDPDAGIQPVDIDALTADSPILLAADAQVTATVAAEALTGGEFHLYLNYVMSKEFDYSQSEATV